MMPFVGRAAELLTIAEALRRLADGHGSMVLVEGEAGMGKTRLLDEGLAGAHESGFHVMRAAAEELERSRPFGALAEALRIDTGAADPERARLARLLAGDDTGQGDTPAPVGGGPGVRYQVTEAILTLVEVLSMARPLVLAVEDLHWADVPSLLTLHALGRRRSHLPLLLVATFRPSPSSPELDALIESLQARGARFHHLDPLVEEDTDRLAAAVAGAPPGPNLKAQLTQAAGNPLFVMELVRAMQDEGQLVVDEGRAEVTGVTVPPRLGLVLLHRLRSSLTTGALDLVRVASVLGASFHLSDLSLLLRRPVVELLPALAEAERAGWLREDGERLAFRHGLVREALYQDLAPGIRAGLHLDMGRALAEAGAGAVEVATHVALGVAPGDRQGVRWLHDAARQLLSRAPANAAEFLERAAAVAGPADPSLDAVLADLVVARLWAGRISGAEALAREVLARHHDPATATTLRLALFETLLAQGRTADAAAEGLEAMGRPEVAGGVRAQLQAEIAFGLLFLGDLDSAAAAATAARDEGELLDDDAAVCIALSALSTVSWARADVQRAIRLATEAVERGRRSPDPSARRFPCHAVLGLGLLDAGRPDAAAAVLHEGRRQGEDFPATLPFYQWAFVVLRYLTGEWGDALAEARTGFDLSKDIETRIGAVAAHSALALISLHRNDLAAAEDSLAAAQVELAASGPQYRAVWLDWGRALLSEALGDGQAALAAIERAWEHSGSSACERPLLGPDLVRLLMAAGRCQDARAVAATVALVSESMGAPWAVGAALRCRGLAHHEPEALLRAVDALAPTGRPLDCARAAEDAAVALSGAGRSAEAVPHLDQALSTYRALEASQDLHRAEASLRRLGVRRGIRGARGGAKTGWAALTHKECELVPLVVDHGLTNRQAGERLYINHRTVESHLAHIFHKLGISSRAELKAAWAKRSA